MNSIHSCPKNMLSHKNTKKFQLKSEKLRQSLHYCCLIEIYVVMFLRQNKNVYYI